MARADLIRQLEEILEVLPAPQDQPDEDSAARAQRHGLVLLQGIEQIRADGKEIQRLERQARKLTGPRIGTRFVKVASRADAFVVESRKRLKARLREAERRKGGRP